MGYKHPAGCQCGLHSKSPEHLAKLAAAITKHGCAGQGAARRAEYRAWGSMKQRCTNPNFPGYADYGGRGVTICERWQGSFENFLADVGEKPEPKSGYLLDLIDPAGNYEPGNVQWAPRAAQYNKIRRFNAERRAA